eukprot:scaffold47527_cov18-Prasinocladus_malaysianus.AAC.1
MRWSGVRRREGRTTTVRREAVVFRHQAQFGRRLVERRGLLGRDYKRISRKRTVPVLVVPYVHARTRCTRTTTAGQFISSRSTRTRLPPRTTRTISYPVYLRVLHTTRISTISLLIF